MARSDSISLLDSQSVRDWSTVRRFSNLLWLASDYLVACAVLAGALWFHFSYRAWGLHWLWHLPVWGAAIVLIGAVQHRIGLMGHESSHNLLIPNRKWNDILAELLCFYPLYASLTTYRAKHLPHHLYPNDPDRDPNMGNGKAERLYAKFPMPKSSFIYHYYLKFFWPPFVFANLLDLLDVMSLGSGLSPVPVRDEPDAKGHNRFLAIKATILGIGYLLILAAILHLFINLDWPVWWAVGGLYAVAVGIWSILPESAFFTAGRLNFPIKAAALLRLTFYTVLFSSMAVVRQLTGWDPTVAYLVLWIFPLIYVFPYLMLLREVCQHANAGTDQLDNSRIINIDPFSRWAVFGYGNDYHLVHHIYPNVPHYALRGTHGQLCRDSDDYRNGIDVTYGTLSVPGSKAGNGMSLLDSLASGAPIPRRRQGQEKEDG